MAGTALRIRLLDGLAVEGVDGHTLGSRKARRLLKVLALAAGRPVAVDRLVDVLWHDAAPRRPGEQLGVLVSRLRAALGAERLLRSDAGYWLAFDWLDVVELTSLVREAEVALAAGHAADGLVHTRAALALAGGELLPEEDGEWVDAEHARVASVVRRAHQLHAELAERVGDHAAAVAAAEAALAVDPYDEVALQWLMRAHRGAGRPASGLAAYVAVRQRLAEDLGVRPTAATEALHDELATGPPGAALAAQDGRAGRAADGDGHIGSIGGAPVGRAGELAVLDAALAAVRRGPAAAVVVVGEAGIGKSTLIEHWTRSVEHGTVVLRGRCDVLGHDLPLQPLADALSERLRALGPAAAATLVGADGPVLDVLLGHGAATAPAATDTAPELGRARLFTALLDVVERLAGDAVVLAIEDLHHAGGSTNAWLRFAQRRGRHLLVVATARSGADVALDAARRLELGPLDRPAVVELFGTPRADDLLARSHGNPLLLHAFAETDGLDPSRPGPVTVTEAVERMVADLGDGEATLRAAAVLGGDVDLDLLAAVLRTPVADLLAHLEPAVGGGLLQERAGRFGFRHDLVRDALAAGAGPARRALVHREASAVLRRRRPPDWLAIASHARAGGAVDLAVEAFVEAAAAALARFDPAAAAAHVDATLELRPDAAALVLRARLRMATLDLQGAGADVAEARRLGGGAAALETSAWVAYYERRYEAARAFAERGAEVAEDDALRASCLAVAGRIAHGAGDLAAARRHLGAAGDVAGPARHVADVWRAHLLVHEGRAHDALTVVAGAFVEPERPAHPWAALHGSFARVMALGHLGHVREALAAVDELDAAALAAGPLGDRFVAIAANLRGWLLRATGHVEAAAACHERALAAVVDAAGTAVQARTEAYWVARLDLLDGRLLVGDVDAAAAMVQDCAALDDWQGTMAWHQRHRLALAHARLALADGRRDVAAELAGAVRDDASARGAQRYALLATAVAALADARPEPERLAPTVAGLDRCASLESWWLLATLAVRHGVDRWQAEAAARAARLVRDLGTDGAALGRLADARLSGRWSS